MEQNVILVSLFFNRDFPGLAERVRAAAEGREVVITGDRAVMETLLPRVEICMGDVPFDLYFRMPRLKWVQLWSAGADRLRNYPGLAGLPVIITSTSGIHGRQITEHLFGLLLAWSRRLPAAFQAQREHRWLKFEDDDISVLAGKTMLILGYGAIGAVAAGTALGFGMKVIGLRRNPEKGGALPGVRLESAGALCELLPLADYVVNILPATKDTAGLFGVAEFGLMKKTALYINVGRGITTNEASLVEALGTGRIAGALLDVTETEPLREDSPLWDLPNVLLTGHYGGMHPEYARMALDVALDNLGRYLRGEPLKNLVDKEAGY
ncbi:MAG: D-2-hydroxyacid dehydrogenase [Treponema sp.]|nr:D-2-hydroxyacid dehydrogenase [Treponema sp.]